MHLICRCCCCCESEACIEMLDLIKLDLRGVGCIARQQHDRCADAIKLHIAQAFHHIWMGLLREIASARALAPIAHIVDTKMYPLRISFFAVLLFQQANLYKWVNAIAFNTCCNLFADIIAPYARIHISPQNGTHVWIWLATERAPKVLQFADEISIDFVGGFSGATHHKHAKLLLNHCKHSLASSSAPHPKPYTDEPHAHRTYMRNENASVAEQRMQSNANKTRKMPTTLNGSSCAMARTQIANR